MNRKDFAHLPPNFIEWHTDAPNTIPSHSDDSATRKGRKDYHGTCVASKVVGRKTGISKHSHLVILKASLDMVDLTWAFRRALKDIHDKQRQAKVVTVLPWTSKYSFTANRRKWGYEWKALLEIVQEIGDKDIITVVSAGNNGETKGRAIDTLPALWAETTVKDKSPHLWIAASISVYGSIAWWTQFGPSSIFASGYVECSMGLRGLQHNQGTSFSTPMVSKTRADIKSVCEAHLYIDCRSYRILAWFRLLPDRCHEKGFGPKETYLSEIRSNGYLE